MSVRISTCVRMYIFMYIFVSMTICMFITKLLVCMTYIRMSIWTYFSICVYPCTIRWLSLVYAYSSVKTFSPSTRFCLRDMIRLLAFLFVLDNLRSIVKWITPMDKYGLVVRYQKSVVLVSLLVPAEVMICLNDELMDWLIDWSSDWLTDWLIE